VTWNATAIPKAISIARSEDIDVVLTTSPPGSIHLVGAAVQKAAGAKWVADLRDSLVAHPHRRTDSLPARVKAQASRGAAALAASALEDVNVRFVGDFRPGDREFMTELGLADRVALIDHVPRRRSLELQRESEALLLLIPEAGGRGRGVLSGKVFEYIAAQRP